jgi:hypothetical protein
MRYDEDIAMQTFGVGQAAGFGLGVSVESMGIISYQKAYRIVSPTGTSADVNRAVTFPLMMAIINVDHGLVSVSPSSSIICY